MRAPTATAFALLTALLAAGPLAPAAQAGFRCDTELVARGMTPLEVLERCGEPVYEMVWTDFRYPGLFVRVDEWTYELGRNKFRRLLTFENGRLLRIETRRKPSGASLPPAGAGDYPPALSRW